MSKTEQILDYLRTRDGIPPTVREIRDALDISSTSVVSYHLDKLEEQGLITRQREKARSIQVVKKASDLLIVIDLPWIPQEEVRGNSRVVWQVKARLVSELVDRGVEYGLVAKQDHPEYEYPLKGPLAIEITAWNTKRIDHENVLIGYKGFSRRPPDGRQAGRVWRRSRRRADCRGLPIRHQHGQAAHR